MAPLMFVLLGMLAINAIRADGPVAPGGYYPIDVNSEDAKTAATKGVSYFEQQESNTQKLKLIKILDAEEQVVAGSNVHVTFEVGVTTCSKNSHQVDCPLDENEEIMKCSVVLFSQPWTNTEDISEASCVVPIRIEKRAPGGYYPIDVNSEDAKTAATKGVSYFEQQESNTQKLKLIKILDAEEQVVAGSNVHVTFEVGVTTCSKNSHQVDCPLVENEEIMRCSVVLFSQPWTNTEDISEARCIVPYKIEKRVVAGSL